MKVSKFIVTTCVLVGIILIYGITSSAEARIDSPIKLSTLNTIESSVKFSIEETDTTSLEQPLRKKKIVVPKSHTLASVSRSGSSSTRTGTTLAVTATGYCSCSKCCGAYASGKTASGTRARWGVVAADTRTLPFGTKFIINGHYSGTVFVVEDRGGAVKGNKIDIWFSSHQEALNWGRRTITITLK